MNLKKEEFKRYRVLVIGDSCEDVFQYGVMLRLCPEAPVPVFNPTERKSNPGMASNVVANLEALGISTDIISNKEDMVKTRIIDERTNQMIVRIDENDRSSRIDRDMLCSIRDNRFDGKKYDAIVISDYDKGFLEEDDISEICERNRNVFLDTKKILGSWCEAASFIKINNFEFEKTEYSTRSLDIDRKLVVTYRDKGAKYLEEWFPVEKVKIKDVSGAGDTFLSGLVSEYLLTEDIRKSIVFAQQCATVVVQKSGVSTV